MIDPLTAFAALKTASSAISSAVKAGRDLSTLVSPITKLAKAEADLSFAAEKKGGILGKLTGAEQTAIEAHFRKEEAKRIRDEMRELFNNKDYSIKGRIANIDAAQKIAHYLHNQGKDVIVSLVSPYLDQREEFKNKLDWQIKEIFVHYSNRIRGREEYHVLGYQNPQFNFVDIDTSDDSPNQSLDIIREELKI